MHKYPLIFFVYPAPRGSEENQFTPLWGLMVLTYQIYYLCDKLKSKDNET